MAGTPAVFVVSRSLSNTLLAGVLLLVTRVSSRCTICRNGQSVSQPNDLLAVPVDATLGLLVLNATSSECVAVQSLGSLCGCPALRDDPCSLCPDGWPPTSPQTELPFLTDLFNGFTPTCQIMEASLQSLSADDALCSASQTFVSDYCGCGTTNALQTTDETAPCRLCGTNADTLLLADKNITLDGFPFRTCGSLSEALELLLQDGSDDCSLLSQVFASYCGCQPRRGDDTTEACKLCQDGLQVPNPQQTMDLAIIRDLFGGITPTCEIFESSISSLDNNSQDCSNAQLFGSVCGCPKVDSPCLSCGGEKIKDDYMDYVPPETEFFYGFSASCGDFESYIALQLTSDSEMCIVLQDHAFLCGCNNGVATYLHADTIAKQRALVWVPRVSACLTLIGSLLIIWDVLTSKRKRRAVYSQLVSAMSVFDALGALPVIVGSAALPAYNQFGNPSYIYAASGNETTCKIQGFFFQLNFTSIFYNVSLSTYYLLVIVYNWRDGKLKKNRWWLHGIPLTIGFGLSFGGIPFYQDLINHCHIQVPPYEETWLPMVFFVFVPIFTTMFLTTITMVQIIVKFFRTDKKAERYRMDNVSDGLIVSSTEMGEISNLGVNSAPTAGRRQVWRRRKSVTVPKSKSKSAMMKLRRQLLVQSALFLVSFYISWSFILATTIKASTITTFGSNEGRLYWFYLASFSIAPLQGFWNSVIYFRLRIVKRWSEWRKARRLARSNSGNQAPLCEARQKRVTSAEADVPPSERSSASTPQSHSDSHHRHSSADGTIDAEVFIAEVGLDFCEADRIPSCVAGFEDPDVPAIEESDEADNFLEEEASPTAMANETREATSMGYETNHRDSPQQYVLKHFRENATAGAGTFPEETISAVSGNSSTSGVVAQIGYGGVVAQIG